MQLLLFGCGSTDFAKIDESEGFGEIDWLSPYAAEEYLRMPKRLRRLEEDHSVLLEGQRLFSEGMLKHMEMIEEVQTLTNEQGEIVRAIRGFLRRMGES